MMRTQRVVAPAAPPSTTKAVAQSPSETLALDDVPMTVGKPTVSACGTASTKKKGSKPVLEVEMEEKQAWHLSTSPSAAHPIAPVSPKPTELNADGIPYFLAPQSKFSIKRWTSEQDDALRDAVKKYGEKNWKAISKCVADRSDSQCLHRWTKVLNPTIKKGLWTKEEDELLSKLVAADGPQGWTKIAQQLPGRIGKQCRERWHNHLDPTIRRDNFTPEEDAKVIQLVKDIGHKWAKISKFMPGRTDNGIKNRWNATLKRRLQRQLEGLPEDDTPEEKKAKAKAKKDAKAKARAAKAQKAKAIKEAKAKAAKKAKEARAEKARKARAEKARLKAEKVGGSGAGKAKRGGAAKTGQKRGRKPKASTAAARKRKQQRTKKDEDAAIMAAASLSDFNSIITGGPPSDAEALSLDLALFSPPASGTLGGRRKGGAGAAGVAAGGGGGGSLVSPPGAGSSSHGSSFLNGISQSFGMNGTPLGASGLLHCTPLRADMAPGTSPWSSIFKTPTEGTRSASAHSGQGMPLRKLHDPSPLSMTSLLENGGMFQGISPQGSYKGFTPQVASPLHLLAEVATPKGDKAGGAKHSQSKKKAPRRLDVEDKASSKKTKRGPRAAWTNARVGTPVYI